MVYYPTIPPPGRTRHSSSAANEKAEPSLSLTVARAHCRGGNPRGQSPQLRGSFRTTSSHTPSSVWVMGQNRLILHSNRQAPLVE